MRTVFADTLYWVALIHPGDQWHHAVLAATRSLGAVRIITAEEVLIEVLNALSGQGVWLRRAALQQVRAIRSNTRVEVVPQTPESFAAGVSLYERRPDKGYSLTDCISMQTMYDRGLSEALTHDRHFEQEGFKTLL